MGENQDSFDLDSYASKYNRHGRIARLNFIAKKSPELEVDALRLLIRDAKIGRDTPLYRDLFARANGRIPEEATLDESWLREVDTNAATQLTKLKTEFANHRTEQIKEPIRMGNNDLGDFYFERGDLDNALKNYNKTRDYCATPSHLMQMHFNIIRVLIALGRFVAVKNQVAKAEQTPDVSKDEVVMAKLKCYGGLAEMVLGNYKEAALKFTSVLDHAPGQTGVSEKVHGEARVQDRLQAEIGDVLALDDVAIYGGLCGLATFDRTELIEHIIDKKSFREFLELVPEVRETIHAFHNSEYRSYLNYLERLKPDLELDMFMAADIDRICGLIRSKALIQYCTPYVAVDLKTMAAAFNTNEKSITEEVSQLIIQNKISARIDTFKNVLYRKEADAKNATFTNALILGQSVFQEVESTLLRMQMVRNGLSVSAPPKR